jgi:hypothetical protein
MEQSFLLVISPHLSFMLLLFQKALTSLCVPAKNSSVFSISRSLNQSLRLRACLRVINPPIPSRRIVAGSGINMRECISLPKLGAR